MAEVGLNPQALEGLSNMYAYQPAGSNFDINAYIGPATAALKSQLLTAKQRAREESGVLNMGMSGPLQARLGGLEEAEMGQETDIVAEMLGRKAQLDYQQQKENEERQRIADAEEEQKKQSQNVGLGGILGNVLGLGASALIPGASPALMGLGAKLGGEVGQSAAGYQYGMTPNIAGGIGDITGYLADQGKQSTYQQMMKQFFPWMNIPGSFGNTTPPTGMNVPNMAIPNNMPNTTSQVPYSYNPYSGGVASMGPWANGMIDYSSLDRMLSPNQQIAGPTGVTRTPQIEYSYNQ